MIEKSLSEISTAIKKHDISVVELVQEQLDIISTIDKQYNCYITVAGEKALIRAEQIQKQIDDEKYKDSVFAGIPVAVKDNMCTKGIRTTCGSKILSNFVPTYNADVINSLESAGAIVIGKTNMDEFAMGSTTETSFFGSVKNPHNTDYVSGGSSGGSAVAVAAGEAVIALGSDTGGSIRQPCSYCGVTGIKPTYGSVSRFGLVAYASSLDQIGPIARNTGEAAQLLDIITRKDAKDSTSTGKLSEKKYCSVLSNGIKGLRIGIPKSYMGEGLDEEVKDAVTDVVKLLCDNGAVAEEFDLESVEYAIPAYYVIAMAEASSNLSRYDGIKYGFRSTECEELRELYLKTRTEGFGVEARRRMLLGAFVLSSGYYDAYYTKAMKIRGVIKKNFDKAFEKYDVILGPTAPATAPKLGESLSDPLKMYLSDIYTVAVNLCGLPAISVPCGKSSKGLPIGVQMIAKAFNEYDLFRAAYAYESVTDGAYTVNGMMPMSEAGISKEHGGKI